MGLQQLEGKLALYNDSITDLEREQEDILHELEFSKLNAVELMKMAKELKRIRTFRRELKNEREILFNLNKTFKKENIITVLACAKEVCNNISKRAYTPRVRTDLKIGRE